MPRSNVAPREKTRLMLSFAGRMIMTIVTVTTLPAIGNGPSTAVSAHADDPIAKWLTGRDLDRFNRFSISVWWTDAQLRDRLSAFASQQNAAIFLDRRVDPSRPINIGMNAVTPEQFLWEVGDVCKLGVCRVDDFYYLGPSKSASQLPIMVQTLAKETTRIRRSSKVDWVEKKPVKTNRLVEPKQLLQDWAKQSGFRIKNLDTLPHDVWSKFELPPTRLDTRVAILLVGFDKWFVRSRNGIEVEIVEFPIVDSGEIVLGKFSDARKLAKQYKPLFDSLAITAKGERLVAKGPPTDLAILKKTLVKAQTAVSGDHSRKSFTLTTTAARESILASIANQTNLQLKFDRTNAAVQKAMREQVEIRVKEAVLDDLLAETLRGTNLKFESVDGQLIISPH